MVLMVAARSHGHRGPSPLCSAVVTLLDLQQQQLGQSQLSLLEVNDLLVLPPHRTVTWSPDLQLLPPSVEEPAHHSWWLQHVQPSSWSVQPGGVNRQQQEKQQEEQQEEKEEEQLRQELLGPEQ